MTGHTAFPDLDLVLADLVTGVQDVLGPAGSPDSPLIGIYLHGSFALGDADGHSDVDFLTVIQEPLDPRQEQGIRSLHRGLASDGRHWSGHLEGSYAPHHELRTVDPARRPWLYVDNGATEMEYHRHDNSAVVRWILRRAGVALTGPPAASLVDPLPPGAIARETRDTLLEWRDWARDEPEALDNAWQQTHAVTQHCRFLYAVTHDAVATKPQAVRWAAVDLGEQWTPLLRQAARDRARPWERVHQQSDPALRDPTLAFMALVRRRAGVGDGPRGPAGS